jgi:hypothetical protein
MAGDIVLAVDGLPVAPNANDSILYGPPGSVVTLTIQKAQPDGRVLDVLLTRASALDLKERPEEDREEEEEESEQEHQTHLEGTHPTVPAAAHETAASHATHSTPLEGTSRTSSPTAAVQPVPPPNTPAWPSQHVTESAQTQDSPAIASTSRVLDVSGRLLGEQSQEADVLAPSPPPAFPVSVEAPASAADPGLSNIAGEAVTSRQEPGPSETGIVVAEATEAQEKVSESRRDSGSKESEVSAPSSARRKEKKKKR